MTEYRDRYPNSSLGGVAHSGKVDCYATGNASLQNVKLSQPDRVNTILESHLQALENRICEAHILCNRLRNIADRLLGGGPENEEGQNMPPKPSALVARIEMSDRDLVDVMNDIYTQVDRLEAL